MKFESLVFTTNNPNELITLLGLNKVKQKIYSPTFESQTT